MNNALLRRVAFDYVILCYSQKIFMNGEPTMIFKKTSIYCDMTSCPWIYIIYSIQYTMLYYIFMTSSWTFIALYIIYNSSKYKYSQI